MIDHIELKVWDYAASKAFYVAALEPLGIAPVMEVAPVKTPSGWACGFGADGKPFFWICEGRQVEADCHVAFTATTREAVDAFHAAALAAGAADNGPQGLRPQYHPNYYGAFVRDLNGWNLEAVCHAPA